MGIQISRIVIPQKNNQKIVDPQKRNFENVDPQKKVEGLILKCGSTKSEVDILWIHKKSSWNFVDPQKYKTERFPVSSAKADVIESVFGTL